ncbi:hypothetical protein TNCV_557251 [Trichonephila clavipes]|uniref:Uncharacterized protein n=1 Tax=Trichonephila clavipes TaxID=2585209 RepID=A0A8X6RMK1_TRICX|nr:hypothetical protein TNCV_557251 [Trichonephila clavipes]
MSTKIAWGLNTEGQSKAISIQCETDPALSPSQYGGYDPRLVTEWVRVRIPSWESVKDDERSGRPQTSCTAENIENVSCGGTEEHASNNDEVKIKTTVLSHSSNSPDFAT